MSIDGFTSMDLTPVFIILFVILLIAMPVGLAMGKKTNNNIYGDDEYGVTREEKNAKIIAKRTTPHPLTPTLMVNMVVFELENGDRVELAIKDSDAYGVMIDGDYGTLRYQGKKFIGFKRGKYDEA